MRLLFLTIFITACSSTQQQPVHVIQAPMEYHYILKPDAIQTFEKARIHTKDLRCNSVVRYGAGLYGLGKDAAQRIADELQVKLDSKTHKRLARIILGYLVRVNFDATQGDNLGVMPLKGLSYELDGKKNQLLLIRTGTMLDVDQPQSCFNSLLDVAHVKHVINLYSGDFPLHPFINKEGDIAVAKGATFYNRADYIKLGKHSWRDMIGEEEDYEKNKATAMSLVASIIKEHILNPNGKPPQGNIMMHCGGGMHRTGMIFGILRKCLNHDPWDLIEAEFKFHTAYVSDEVPNGFEKLNLQFIKEYNCKLLEN